MDTDIKWKPMDDVGDEGNEQLACPHCGKWVDETQDDYAPLTPCPTILMDGFTEPVENCQACERGATGCNSAECFQLWKHSCGGWVKFIDGSVSYTPNGQQVIRYY